MEENSIDIITESNSDNLLHTQQVAGSSDKIEVDLIIERAKQPITLIEIKSTNQIDERHVHGLTEIGKQIGPCRKFLISNDKTRKVIAGAECYYWKDYFDLLARD